MEKYRKHSAEFKLQIVKNNLSGTSIRFLSKKWNISTSIIRKWIDHHHLSGAKGLLPKRHLYHTREFKLKVVNAYKDNGLSLRDCCLQFNIPSLSTVATWARQYEQQGINGLSEQKGRPGIMKKDKPPGKKNKPLTRLEELEKDNLYLRAEIDYLKKLDALTQEKQTQQKKRR
jgi:transposase